MTVAPTITDADPPGLSRADLHHRTLRVLVIAQVFGGAGLAAGVIVGAIFAKDVLGSTSSAGLPAAVPAQPPPRSRSAGSHTATDAGSDSPSANSPEPKEAPVSSSPA